MLHLPTHAGKIYTCGGYGNDRAAMVRIDASNHRGGCVPCSGEAPASLDCHSVTSSGAKLQPFLLFVMLCYSISL